MSRSSTIALPFDGPEHRDCRGPNGRRHCRRCGREVPKGRVTWCGEECVGAYMVAMTPRMIFRRDHGVCAGCGLDTEALRVRLDGIMERRRRKGGEDLYARARRLRESIYRVLKARGFNSLGSSLWEADHIIPVVEGGPTTFENLRTLCVPCHKAETAGLKARLALKRLRQRRGLLPSLFPEKTSLCAS